MTDDPLLAVLDRTGIDYEIFPCDPDLADTAAFCEAYGFSLTESANTILVMGKVDPPPLAACVVLAHTRLDVNSTVRRRFGVKKASFAPAEVTESVTGMAIGGVTPFGLPDEVPLWIDGRVMDLDRVVLGGGSRDRKVLAAPEVLTAIGGEVVDALAKEIPS